ncbi:hypothetical protein TCAL_09826 [Tigriopus californicus]|uniref:Uncharacterized protein n=2 Tax=Tigriopus californicus TaxID=6832 RepID=A0A553PNX1_TIGCA|nr:hypothetical protein TCAL_09826 [Tigriopus californicus]
MPVRVCMQYESNYRELNEEFLLGRMGHYQQSIILTGLSVILGLVAFVACGSLEASSVGEPQGQHEARAHERSIYKRSIGPAYEGGDYFLNGDNNYAAKRQAGYNAWRKGKRAHSIYEPLTEPASPSSYGSMVPNHFFDLLALNALPQGDLPEDPDQASVSPSLLASMASAHPSIPNKRTPYSQWRKNGKREYRDWRKGKRDHGASDEVAEDLFMINPDRRSEMGFKQWRKMG